MDDFHQQQESLLNSALNDLPRAPLPPDFIAQVMARVHAVQAPVPRAAAPIRFRLQFLDIALAGFWSLALGAIWLFVLWWAGLLPLSWLPQVQSALPTIAQPSLANPALLLAGAIIILLELILLGLVGMNVLGERPFPT